MDIQPLNGILNGIGSGDEWDNQRLLQRLITQWHGIVGSTVSKHSRPLEIHNGVLQVATSTAVWAQNLSFERRRILKKLNSRPDFKLLGLKEIRFSTAQWHSRPGSQGARPIDKRLHSYHQQLQWQQHPSRMPPPEDESLPANPAQSAPQAFARWSHRRQQQVRQVPLCPQCQTPAPQGELQRWGLCAFCMTQQWQAVKEANHPDGSEGEPWHEVTPEEREEQDAAAPASRREMADMLAEERSGDGAIRRGTKAGKSGSKKGGRRKVAQPQRSHSSTAASPEPVVASPKTELRSAQGHAPQAEPPQPDAPRSGLTELSRLAQLVQHRSEPKAAKPMERFRDPALSGPLAPLSAEPPVVDAVSQDPFAPVIRQLDPQDEERGAQNPVTQKQVAWAQAFQTQKSLEEARQAQQAELQQRVAFQAQQIARDRIQAQAESAGSSIEPEGDATVQGSMNLASGNTKPVLKKPVLKKQPPRRRPPKNKA